MNGWEEKMKEIMEQRSKIQDDATELAHQVCEKLRLKEVENKDIVPPLIAHP